MDVEQASRVAIKSRFTLRAFFFVYVECVLTRKQLISRRFHQHLLF